MEKFIRNIKENLSNMKLDKSTEKIMLFMSSDNLYEKEIPNILQSLIKQYKKICFASSSMTADNFSTLCEEQGLDSDKFVFIDTLSSYYGSKINNDKRIYLKNPSNLNDLKEAIIKCVKEKSCNAIFIESLSDYWSSTYIMEFFMLINHLLMDKNFKDVGKFFYLIKNIAPDDYDERVQDFVMLAGKAVKIG